MEQEITTLYNNLTPQQIEQELTVLESIDYTPDFYDYVVASMNTVLPILYCHGLKSNFKHDFDTNDNSVRSKLKKIGIESSTDLQQRYLIFFRLNKETQNLSIVYFYNGPLSMKYKNMHIISLYSERATLSMLFKAFEESVLEKTKEYRDALTKIEKENLIKVSDVVQDMCLEEQLKNAESKLDSETRHKVNTICTIITVLFSVGIGSVIGTLMGIYLN